MVTIGIVYNEGGSVIIFERGPESAAISRRRSPALKRLTEYLSTRLGTKVMTRYDEHAGCSMCACSPGFKLVAAERTPKVAEICMVIRRQRRSFATTIASLGMRFNIDLEHDGITMARLNGKDLADYPGFDDLPLLPVGYATRLLDREMQENLSDERGENANGVAEYC